jgi:hypothetical protein
MPPAHRQFPHCCGEKAVLKPHTLLRSDLLAATPGVLISLLLMLPLLSPKPLVLDEHGTWWIVADGGPLNLVRRSLEYENIPPLSPAIHWLFIKLFGKSEIAFRLPTVLFHLAAVLTTSVFGSRLLDRRMGLAAGIILALQPETLDETRIARCYALSLFLGALLLLAVLEWIRQPARRTGPLLWLTAATGLVWTHYLNAPAAIASLAILMRFLRLPEKTSSSSLLLPVTIAALATMPLLPPVFRMYTWGNLFEFQADIAIDELLPALWWCGLPLATLIRLRIRDQTSVSTTRKQLLRWLTILFVALPVLAVAACTAFGSFSLAAPRYRTAFQPAAAICWSFWAVRGLRLRHSAAILCCCLAAVWCMEKNFPWTPVRLEQRQAAQWQQIASFIAAHSQPSEPIFVQGGLGDAWLLNWMYEDPVLHDFVACRCGSFYLPTQNTRYGLPMLWDNNADYSSWYLQLIQNIRDSSTPGLWLAVATDTDLNIASSVNFETLLRNSGFQSAEHILLPDAAVIHFVFEE